MTDDTDQDVPPIERTFRAAVPMPRAQQDTKQAYLDLREEWQAGAPVGTEGSNSAPAVRRATAYPARERGAAGGGVVSAEATGGRGSNSHQPETHVRGLARNVESDRSLRVLSFRVDQYDASGNRLDPVGVELHQHTGGHLGEGEEVEAWGQWKHGALRAHRVVNLTTGADVRGVPRWVKRSIIAFVCGVAVLVVVGAIVAISVVRNIASNLPSVPGFNDPGLGGTAGSPTAAPFVAVPKVAGEDNVQAAQSILAANLRPSGQFEKSATVPFGQVTRTDPPAGTNVPADSTVTFFISTGP